MPQMNNIQLENPPVFFRYRYAPPPDVGGPVSAIQIYKSTDGLFSWETKFVPEPSSFALCGCAVSALALIGRRMRRR
jgi:hypothetical protein